METLEINITELKSLLEKTLYAISGINDDNFDENNRIAQSYIKKVNILRERLKKEYDFAVLRNFDPELLSLTKQIKASFDNIIRKKKFEAEKVSKDLKTLQNSKKLTSYKR